MLPRISCIVQVASFALTALFSGVWFALWARRRILLRRGGDVAGNDRVWRHLGWFSGLICAGSVVGTAAWVVSIQQNNFYFQSMFQSQGYTSRQHYVLDASSFRFNAIFLALYPVEFLCLIVPKLMLLGRLADNAIRSQVHAPDVKGRIKRLLDRVGTLQLSITLRVHSYTIKRRMHATLKATTPTRPLQFSVKLQMATTLQQTQLSLCKTCSRQWRF